MQFRGKFWGLLVLILGVSIAYISAWHVTAWAELMPDTYLSTLFWAGYLGQLFLYIFVKPYMIILKNDDGGPLGVGQGIVSFMFGIVLSLILYNIYEVFFGSTGLFTSDPLFPQLWQDIFWFGYVLITVFGMVIIPLWLGYDEPLNEKIQQLMPQ